MNTAAERLPRPRPDAELGDRRECCHSLHATVLRNAERMLGSAVLASRLREAGEERSLEVLLDTTRWCTYDETVRLLEILADALGCANALEEAASSLDRGSVPETAADIVAAFQSLGGPAGILLEVTKAASKFSTVIGMQKGEVTSHSGVVTLHMAPGFTPHPLVCVVAGGLLSVSSQLFGLPPAMVTHDRCTTRGDSQCRFRVRWDANAPDAAAQALHWEQELAGVRTRYNALRTTVAELVSGDDVETALQRIIERSALAVRAPRYMLAVHINEGEAIRIHTVGFSADGRDAVAAELLDHAGEPARSSRLVMDIRSGRRYYGRLAAFAADGQGFFEEERATFAAYAELAAAALDSATAMDEVRRQGETARALLDLACAVADVTTSQEVAVRLATAVPRVVGSGVAGVLLCEGGHLVAAASHGLRGEALALFDAVRLDLAALPRLRQALELREPRFVATGDAGGEIRQLLAAAGATATVIVPIHVGDQLYGAVCAGVASDVAQVNENADLVARLTGLAALAATAFQNAELLERLHHLSMHDALTGTPNQRLLEDRLDKAVAASRRSGAPTGLLFLDLDRFKNINDTLGHPAGDDVLCQVAARLQHSVRQVDTVARLGGDEFAVVLAGLTTADDADVVAEKLLSALQAPLVVHGQEVFINASVGIAVAPDDGVGYADLLKAADAAMYVAKAAGRGTHRAYNRTMTMTTTGHLDLEADLHHAVARDELRLVFQPQIDLRTMTVVGAEALVRWQHPTRGLLTPDDFIVLAEETGLVTDVDAWVLRQACEHLRRWRVAGRDGLTMSVNVSERDLHDRAFGQRVGSILADTGADPAALELEITERVAETTTGEMVDVLDDLQRLGVRIAIDDFGTGNSAFSRLLRGRIDTLKIDRSFLDEVSATVTDTSLVAAMIALGHSLGLVVVAEGIETAAQSDYVRVAGCDLAQGFFFGAPMSALDLEAILDDRWT